MNLKKLWTLYLKVKVDAMRIDASACLPAADACKDLAKDVNAFARESVKLGFDPVSAYAFIRNEIDDKETFPFKPLTIARLIVDCQGPALVEDAIAADAEPADEMED